MTDRQDPGPEQDIKLTDDEFDTEGNKRRYGHATETPLPDGPAEADSDEDTEGNKRGFRFATETPQPDGPAESDTDEDTEGNRRSYRG